MILLIGAGPMAQAYAKVLISLKEEFVVIGRGKKSADEFHSKTGVTAELGGLDAYIQSAKLINFDSAIVATGVEKLFDSVVTLINAGIKRILVEKPGGLDLNQISKLDNIIQSNQVDVFVAYNRRFYKSVIEAMKIIEEDGGVSSFNFEVTEWGHVIEKIQKAEGVKENWFLANTTHVTDLAFFLGGVPREINCFTNGGLEWHKRSSVFSGAGISETGALFSYHGNWQGAGRWSVEILTAKHKLILCPMEKLKIQKLGSIEQNIVELDYQLDEEFKPGIYKQLNAFIYDKGKHLCPFNEHAKNAKIYAKIANY